MFGRYCCYAAFAALSAHPFAAAAHELGAHVHGVATLRVAVDAQTMTLDFSSPLSNLIGFEHPPRNEKELAAVKIMAAKFGQADRLFVATAEARCTLRSTRLDSPVLAPEAASAGKDVSRRDGERTHADLDGEFVFACERADKLHDLELRLFDDFPGIRRVKMEVATLKKQAAAELGPDRRRMDWQAP